MRFTKERIFIEYSQNLKMLANGGVLHHTYLSETDIYICPLCLNRFTVDDLENSGSIYLTIEHVPPDSLGGKGSILTCNSCNSRAGSKVDSHLLEYVKIEKRKRFERGEQFSVVIENFGYNLNASLSIDEEGKWEFDITRYNDPKKVDKITSFIQDQNSERIIDFSIKPRNKIISRSVKVALLRIAYLLTFKEFGYLFILSPFYDLIRNQIKYPDKKLIDFNFWDNDIYENVPSKIFLMKNVGSESVVCNFDLTFEGYKRPYLAFLPLPLIYDYNYLFGYQRAKFQINLRRTGFPIRLKRNLSDCLTGLKTCYEINDWINLASLHYLGF